VIVEILLHHHHHLHNCQKDSLTVHVVSNSTPSVVRTYVQY
jgi:hypothetical protein